ncbi:hypothetical protein EBZ57_03025 [bacterium]|nr:hypothetical protein [bacterium]
MPGFTVAPEGRVLPLFWLPEAVAVGTLGRAFGLVSALLSLPAPPPNKAHTPAPARATTAKPAATRLRNVLF